MAIGRETQTGGDGQRRAREALTGAAQEAQARGQEKLEQGREAAASRTDRIASAVERAAEELGDDDRTLASYASQLADGMHRMADSLRNRSANELAADVQALARRNPMLFLMGSVAVGLALSRFMKASSQRESSEYRSASSSTAEFEYDDATPPSSDDAIARDPGLTGSPPPAH
jgi:hypothetical protein